MQIYNYNSETCQYVSSGNARIDPMDSNRYLIPANATIVKPPEFNALTQTCIFTGYLWIVSARYIAQS
jgi:hypothetical protein